MLERRPLYEQVRQQVLDYIAEHDLHPGDVIPTEAELAARYGVSVGTVRRALRQLVDQEILYRQPGRGTFLTEHSRQRAMRRGFLACIVPYIRNAFASSVIAGAQFAAQRANYAPLLYNSYGQPDLEEELLRQSLGSVAGIVLLPVARTTLPPVLEELLHRRFPLVFADRLPTLDTNYVNYVTSDNHGGAYAAVQHLIELGHRRIALALRREREANIERLQEFLQREQPSALFAVNDLIAIDAWRAAEGAGLSIPQDLSIVGFDDADFLRDVGLALTTVSQDAFGIGHEAVEVLTECIEGEVSVPQQAVLPTRLVVRTSSQAYGGIDSS